MESIAERVRRRREDIGKSQSELARSLGVKPQAIQALEAGNVKKPRFIVPLAKALGVSPEYLETGSHFSLSENNPALQSFKVVKEYDVTVSAGGGAFVADENVRGEWPFDPSYLSNELGLGNAQLALLEVRGDSMEPTLSSGDRVMVNMSDRQVSQPGIFILYDGGGTVIKRVEKVPGMDKLVLISDNARHTQYEVDGDTIQIVGRVVWAARRM